MNFEGSHPTVRLVESPAALRIDLRSTVQSGSHSALFLIPGSFDPDVPEITVSPDIVAEEIHLRRKNLQGTDEF
jgi:hypothetical protein